MTMRPPTGQMGRTVEVVANPRHIAVRSNHSLMLESRSRDKTWVGVAVLVVMGLFVVFLVGCVEPPEPKGPSTYSGYDSTEIPEKAVEPAAQRVDPCDTAHHAAFRKASPMAKQMLRGERYDLQDDVSAFAVLDSFRHSTDPTTREFYFLVMTRALAHSDGYYSEGISVTSYGLYDSLPCEFLSHFVELRCLGDSDLTNWSSYLGFEFFLDGNDITIGKLDRAQAWIRNKCRTCSVAEKQVAERINSNLKASVEAMPRDQ